MTRFDSSESFDDAVNNAAISMFDEEGNEAGYHILATKRDGDCLYMLAESDEIDDLEAEVLIFKCIAEGEPDEMIFELVDEEHESFEPAFSLFKEDLDKLEIEY